MACRSSSRRLKEKQVGGERFRFLPQLGGDEVGGQIVQFVFGEFDVGVAHVGPNFRGRSEPDSGRNRTTSTTYVPGWCPPLPASATSNRGKIGSNHSARIVLAHGRRPCNSPVRAFQSLS